MAFSTTPLAGINLTVTVPADFTTDAGTVLPNVGPLGLAVHGSDGKRYVLAQANASIPASTAVCTVNASTFLVTASGGAYTSPAVAVASGEYAWFSATSV